MNEAHSRCANGSQSRLLVHRVLPDEPEFRQRLITDPTVMYRFFARGWHCAEVITPSKNAALVLAAFSQ